MRKYISELFANLSWKDTLSLILMMCFTIAVPISWRLGLWALMLMILVSIVGGKWKWIISGSCRLNPTLERTTLLCYLPMMILWVIYLISLYLSSFNRKEGLTSLFTMAPLLVIPLFYFMANFRLDSLRRKHVSALIYLLAITLTIRFIIMLIGAVIHYFQGTPLKMLIDFHFDPLHHNYLALYLLTAVALLYTELTKHWKDQSWRRLRWVVLADMALLTLYMVISGSRSGLVIFVLLAVACMAHLAFVKKQWKATGIIIIGLTVLIGASYLAMPRLYWRIIYSAEKIASGEQGDSRQTLWVCGVEALDGHLILGHGLDGYWDLLRNKYINHHFAEGYEHEEYNTHNQFLETTLATGLVGLTALLAMIVVPLIPSFRKPRRNLPFVLFTIVYVGSLMFEVSFARQMGLLFICWWYCLLIYYRQIPE